MAQLRARFDIIIVLDVDGRAVQYEFPTVLRDHLEVTRRCPKAGDEPALFPMRLAWVSAQRLGIVNGDTFDQFVDRCLDMQLDEATPLTPGRVGGADSGPGPDVPDTAP